jgi:hypothetical protein
MALLVMHGGTCFDVCGVLENWQVGCLSHVVGVALAAG